MTVQNEAMVFPEDEAPVPVGDETPIPDRGEAQVCAEEEMSVAAQGEPSVEDEVRVIGAEEVPGPAGDEAPTPVEDEAQATPHDKVRFFVEVEAPPAAKDKTEVEDRLPVPIGESALIPHGDEAPIPIREVAKEEESLERRKHARFAVKGGAKGRVAAVWDAVLLDLSLGGALIEHANVVRPGTPSSLELELQGKKIRLRCRVARSVADRIEKQPDGERELVYRTGLQFVEPSDETLQVIGDCLHSLTEDE